MTTLQGEFVTNSKSIAWLLRVMQRTSPVDADTTQVIQGGLAKNLSDDTQVQEHRQFVVDAIPHSQQRVSVVSDHLQNDIPRLQVDLESIGFVITEANKQQTQILGTILDDHTDTIMQSIAGLTTMVGELPEKIQLAKCVGGNADRQPHSDSDSQHPLHLSPFSTSGHKSAQRPVWQSNPDEGYPYLTFSVKGRHLSSSR